MSLILMSLAAFFIFAGCGEKKTKEAEADIDDETEETVSYGNGKKVDGGGKDIFSMIYGISPRDVAVKWSKAIADGDLKTANKYSTENTQPLNALAIALMSASESKDSDKDSSIGIDKEKFDEYIEKLKDAEEKIDGDTATLVVDGEEGCTLKKVDGEWKVDMKK